MSPWSLAAWIEHSTHIQVFRCSVDFATQYCEFLVVQATLFYSFINLSYGYSLFMALDKALSFKMWGPDDYHLWWIPVMTMQSQDLLYHLFCPSFLDRLSQTERLKIRISFKEEWKLGAWERAAGAWVWISIQLHSALLLSLPLGEGWEKWKGVGWGEGGKRGDCLIQKPTCFFRATVTLLSFSEAVLSIDKNQNFSAFFYPWLHLKPIAGFLIVSKQVSQNPWNKRWPLTLVSWRWNEGRQWSLGAWGKAGSLTFLFAF